MPRPVGITRVRLARKLQEFLRSEGLDCDVAPEDLYPAEGYWRKSVADVMRWEGFITARVSSGRVRRVMVCSWDRMSECARGLGVGDHQDLSGWWSIEVHAVEPIKKRC